jgi:hypothetical protein
VLRLCRNAVVDEVVGSGGGQIALARRLRFWTVAANRNSLFAPVSPRRRRRVKPRLRFISAKSVSIIFRWRAETRQPSVWLLLSIGLYLVTGSCWVPVVWLQVRMHRLAEAALAAGTALPDCYHRYARCWFWLGWPAFGAVLAIFYLMVGKSF